MSAAGTPYAAASCASGAQNASLKLCSRFPAERTGTYSSAAAPLARTSPDMTLMSSVAPRLSTPTAVLPWRSTSSGRQKPRQLSFLRSAAGERESTASGVDGIAISTRWMSDRSEHAPSWP